MTEFGFPTKLPPKIYNMTEGNEQDDFPLILMIVYIVIMFLFYRFSNNFWLSFSLASIIYSITYIIYKVWKSGKNN